LANIKSAKKRIRQTEKRTIRNRYYIAGARTYIKQTRQLADAGKLDEAEVMGRQAYSALDKAARKGVIHRGNAARRKGRLMAYVAAAKAAAE